MESLGLLVGHLLGDYIFQNDWMAKWKLAKAEHTEEECKAFYGGGYGDRRGEYLSSSWPLWRPFWACTVHCLLYTLCVWGCSFWWMPWWGLLACFLVHWPIDRWRLAGHWMRHVSGQYEFATGSMAPWSIIVVDNTFHLLTLFAIGLAVWL